MHSRAWPFIAILAVAVSVQIAAQNPSPTPAQGGIRDPVYVCPHDPDIRSNSPGVCPRCGATLVDRVPDPVEYHVDLSVTPRAPKPNEAAHLKFVVRDPWRDEPVKKFIEVHERLFHAFIISDDLQFFLHDHPKFVEADAAFYYDIRFPKPATYRILGDFYPDGSTPQLIPKTIIVPGGTSRPVKLDRDYSPKQAENMRVEFETVPPQAIAAQETQLYFRISPGEGFQKYLGAWGHMLVASDDVIDMLHQHPFIADGGPQVEFKVVFPRARTYRVWVQFQRNGVVNTAHFDIPVKELGL